MKLRSIAAEAKACRAAWAAMPDATAGLHIHHETPVDMTDTTNQTYRLIVDERIRELLRWRQWYRRTPWAAEWSDLRRENEVELRALLRLARKARKLAAAAPDPVTSAKGWNAALTDPAFHEALDEGLADVEAGRTVGWPLTETESRAVWGDR